MCLLGGIINATLVSKICQRIFYFRTQVIVKYKFMQILQDIANHLIFFIENIPSKNCFGLVNDLSPIENR